MIKSKIRFNIIDFLIIIAILGCVLGIAVRYNLMDKVGINSSRDEAEISFIIMSIRGSSYDAMKIGDAFSWKQNNMLIGTLTDKKENKSEVFVKNNNLEMVKAIREDRYDVRGTLLAKGIMTDDGFMLNGTQYMASGKNIIITSKNITVSITITDINIVNKS